MVEGFHASDGESILMEPPSQIIQQTACNVHNEMSRLRGYSYFIRINTLSIYLIRQGDESMWMLRPVSEVILVTSLEIHFFWW